MMVAKPPSSAELSMTKRCQKCGELKNLSDFYRRANATDGREQTCIACRNGKSSQIVLQDRVGALRKVVGKYDGEELTARCFSCHTPLMPELGHVGKCHGVYQIACPVCKSPMLIIPEMAAL